MISPSQLTVSFLGLLHCCKHD